jgi:hypothetical protein
MLIAKMCPSDEIFISHLLPAHPTGFSLLSVCQNRYMFQGGGGGKAEEEARALRRRLKKSFTRKSRTG